jgi:hypothetical protein
MTIALKGYFDGVCRVGVAAAGTVLVIAIDYCLALLGEPRAVWFFSMLGLL